MDIFHLKVWLFSCTLLAGWLPLYGNAREESVIDLTQCSPAYIDKEGSIEFSTLDFDLLYVDFWASWCGPCKLSFPFMNQLHNEFRDKGLKIIAISVDRKEADAKKFLSRTPATFTVALDGTGACPSAFNVKGMPHSFLLDRTGRVRHSHVGFRPADPEELKHTVTQWLAKESSQHPPPD